MARRGSVNAAASAWQVAQDCPGGVDSRVSKNKRLPRSCKGDKVAPADAAETASKNPVAIKAPYIFISLNPLVNKPDAKIELVGKVAAGRVDVAVVRLD